MNRLVIIGNGFDLAHGLPTGYGHFIDWYWKNLVSTISLFPNNKFAPIDQSDEMIKIHLQFGIDTPSQMKKIELEFSTLTAYTAVASFIQNYSKENERGDPHFKRNNCKLEFNNSFFKLINERKSIQNWVDIENEYYKLLKNCLDEEDNSKVRKLNEEFKQVKNLLEKYLNDNIAEKYDFQIPNEYYQEILKTFSVEPLYLSKNPNHIYFKEFSKEDYNDLINFDNKLVDSCYNSKLHQDFASREINQRNLILNFNYTPVIDKYVSAAVNGTHLHQHIAFGETWQIQIHGKLFDVDNPINFGFGDEMDEGYNLLERKADNEYLRNIKSFQYLQNSNYKDVLDFIKSEKFQVYIMGHSCGLSDRILLNTIFEHNNCRSIKVFYHERNGKDNYTDIVQNISRHFNKKKMMRDKIVNKSLCQPLPQTIRFAEK